jgi:hypothetical protein
MQSENDNDESGKPDKYSRLGQQDLVAEAPSVINAIENPAMNVTNSPGPTAEARLSTLDFELI